LFEANIERNKKEKSEFFSFFYTKIVLLFMVRITIIIKKRSRILNYFSLRK